MTPEETKKIAEEYVNDIVNRMGIPKDYVSAETKKGLRYDCEPILQWLTARYYLVEKGKVEQEMINANQNIDLYKLYPKVRYANEGVKRVLTKLFGPDIRKEEEE